MKSVVVLGGGLAGLLTSIQLAKAGIRCVLFEKKEYPFHRVCGEYVSNEAIPFLKSLAVFPSELNPPQISKFMLSSVSGKSQTLPLDLGGFGISRFSFDHYLFRKAIAAGVDVHVNTNVDSVEFRGDHFHVGAGGKELETDLVVASFGKRSNLDVKMQRQFIRKRSPYLGVKYHIKADHPAELVALHNFPGGYCGISRIEDDKVNLCYLVHRDQLRAHKSIADLERAVLFRNPLIRRIYQESEFLFEKPETINEISFETKGPVDAHMLMVGDAAGMITPLCGNGMAMAMHGSKLASDLAIKFCTERAYRRQQLEHDYARAWNGAFQRRLWFGRQIQRLFGSEKASAMAVNLAVYLPFIASTMIRSTHGRPF